ncbi:hypothetical protein KKF86_05235 [bacterium]|nr:hypothetical protein [bacterium]
MTPKLSKIIIALLAEKLNKKESTIKKDISLLRTQYSKSTPNAVAQIYARENNKTVWRHLSQEDRDSMPNLKLEKPVTIKVKTKKTKSLKPRILKYETSEYFINEHIKEINRAYNANCFTSVFILSRKVVENLIIDILKNKYPKDINLYYNSAKRRNKDFSVVLESIYSKRNDFPLDGKKIVERLVALAKPLKKDTNDKTHSWYHIVTRSEEINNLKLQEIIELIIKLEQNVGIK